MDLLREHSSVGRALSMVLRLGAIAGGLAVIAAGFWFAANLGEIMFGAPIIFVGAMLIAAGIRGRWIRRARPLT